jgi:hypothetical protein
MYVRRFSMLYDYPEDADTTMLEIPAEYGAGAYVIQYMWSGYYDCIDVNVLATTSTDLFGGPSGVSGYDRVDHCEFIESYSNFAMVGTCRGISTGASVTSCQSNCAASASCNGIQVVQSQLHPLVVAAKVWSGTEHVNQSAACASGLKSNFVCYGLTTGTPQVGGTYRVSADPEDPVFYNSCFKKSAGWSFQQVCSTCEASPAQPGWYISHTYIY